jgi:ParB/RepB/Spo0J family partition protein
MKVAINLIDPNPKQPRTIFDQGELAGLAKTIKKHGVILPLAVEPAGNRYILIDGERRLRAAKIAGLKAIEVVIKPRSNGRGTDRLTKALIANVQRTAMGPLDEARAYQTLVRDLGSAEAVADEIGVSNTTISTRLSLLEFPEQVQRLFNLKRIPLDPKVIAAFKRLTPEQQIRVATRAAIRHLSYVAILNMAKREIEGRGGIRAEETREERDPVRRALQCARADQRQGTARERQGSRGENLPGLSSLPRRRCVYLQRVPAAGLPAPVVGR